MKNILNTTILFSFISMPLVARDGLDFTAVSYTIPLIPHRVDYRTYLEDNIFPTTCSILELDFNRDGWKLGISLIRVFQMGLWNPPSWAGFMLPIVIEKESCLLKDFDAYLHIELPIIGVYANRRGDNINMDNAIFLSTGIRRKIFWTRGGIGMRIMYLLSPSPYKDYLSGKWWFSIDLTYDIGVFKILLEEENR